MNITVNLKGVESWDHQESILSITPFEFREHLEDEAEKQKAKNAEGLSYCPGTVIYSLPIMNIFTHLLK